MSLDDIGQPTVIRRRPSREWRAALTFFVAAVFIVVALGLYSGLLPATPPITRLALLIGPLLGAAALIIAAAGLSAGKRWARWAMTPILVVLVVAGVVMFVLTLVGGGIDIPLGAFLALWALSAPPEAAPPDVAPSSEPGARRRVPWLGVVLLAVVGFATSWPVLALVLLQPGGLFIAASQELTHAIATTGGCDDGNVAPREPPAIVDVVVAWSWDRAEPLAAGVDTITIEWFTMGGDGPAGYTLDTMETLESGITESNRWVGATSAVVLAIDLGARGFEPGEARLRLRRPNAVPSGSGSVEVVARYAHAPSDIYGTEVTGSAVTTLWWKEESASCQW